MRMEVYDQVFVSRCKIVTHVFNATRRYTCRRVRGLAEEIKADCAARARTYSVSQADRSSGVPSRAGKSSATLPFPRRKRENVRNGKWGENRRLASSRLVPRSGLRSIACARARAIASASATSRASLMRSRNALLARESFEELR